MNLHRVIDASFPADHSDQIDAIYYIKKLAKEFGDRPFTFVDLGAGSGVSFDQARRESTSVEWIGVDIEDSAEVRGRRRSDCTFLSYDGVNIPLPAESADVIYSRQVFEHVRRPEELMRDIARVLKPGGHFVGSVSQLEPYHSNSFWNFTYYGFATIAHEAGLRLVEFRPGIDGLSLITRNFVKFFLRSKTPIFGSFFDRDSPLNFFINAHFSNEQHVFRNKAKVAMAGHLCFHFTK